MNIFHLKINKFSYPEPCIQQEHEERIRNLQEENITLKKKLEQIERELEQTKMALIQSKEKNWRRLPK